jgi:hypothetical protein
MKTTYQLAACRARALIQQELRRRMVAHQIAAMRRRVDRYLIEPITKQP